LTPEEQLIKSLKDKVRVKNETICKLRDKVVTYDEILAERNDLQSKLNDVQLWMEDLDKKEKQMNKELLKDYDEQLKKLKEAEETLAITKTENRKLIDFNDAISEQLNTVSMNEIRHHNEIKELELCQKRAQNELCSFKVSLTYCVITSYFSGHFG